MSTKKLTVEKLCTDLKQTLELNLISGKDGLFKEIKSSQINRLGLALAGHFSYFPQEHIQICGLTEHSYLQNLSAENRYNII